MSRRARIMRGLSKAAYDMALVLVGAQAFAHYLIYTHPALTELLRPLSSNLQLALFVCLIARLSLDRRSLYNDLKEPSPRSAGVAVVLITGIAASVAAGRTNYLYALLIAAGTLTTAAVVWRFATAHANEIGEARFPSVAAE